MTRTVADVAALRAVLGPARRAARSVGLVPTMGALHAGHLSLVAAARRDCDVVVASVFVNPLQFGPAEDYDAYPRDAQADAALLADAGVDVVFAPEASSFTPPGRRTTVHVAGLTDAFEGAQRPGHFDGVATVVTKLLAASLPDRAYFGEKDYQQLTVIRSLVADLDLPVVVVTCPLVRDADGLALSSRNGRLSTADRTAALALPRALLALRDDFDGDADAARLRLRADLAAANGVEVDYAEVVDPATLEPLRGRDAPRARALAAVRVGGVRLLDTVQLG